MKLWVLYRELPTGRRLLGKREIENCEDDIVNIIYFLILSRRTKVMRDETDDTVLYHKKFITTEIHNNLILIGS